MIMRHPRSSWIVWAVLSILTAGCADRERLTESLPPQDLDSEIIGSGGGVLEAQGFRLIVPPGAFLQDATLVLRDVTAAAPEDERRVTSVFEVSGIPETIALPCSLQLVTPVAGAGDGSRAVLVEEMDTYISSAARFGRCPITLACDDAGSLVRALLPATPAEEAGNDAPQTATGTVQVSVVGNLWSYVTPQQHFEILYGLTILQNTAVEVGAQLENAYAMLRDDLGLSWAKRTRRIKVTMQAFSGEDAEKWGLHVASKWYGVEYDEILLNKTVILETPGSDDLKATLGHELFHLMQHLYDPRTRITQGMPNEWFWVNEAMSTWFERKMIGRTWVPVSVRETDYRFFLAHALQYTPTYSYGVSCTDCWMVQNHGYGASLFLGATFEGVVDGEKKIGEVLKLRLEGKQPLESLQQVLGVYAGGLQTGWRTFCQTWLDGAVYPDVPTFPSPSKIVEGRSEVFTFNAVDQSSHTFQWQSSNYAGRLFLFYFSPEAAIPLTASATLNYVDEEGGSELIAYEYKRDAIWRKTGSLSVPGHPLAIPDIGEWAANSKGLAVLVLRTGGMQTGLVPVAVQLTIDRCDPAAAVVLNGLTIPETKVTRASGGCVTKIDLSWMSLTDPDCLDGIDQYATALEEVSLLHNTLGGVNLTDLGRCTALKKLDLRYTGLQSVDLDPLKTCKNLEVLNLEGNQLTSINLTPLSTCTKIREFWVRDNQIQGINLTPLAVGDSLRMLLLSNNYLDGIDLTPTASMPNLATLEMNGCDLSSANLAPLASCSNLYFLAMGQNRISTVNLAPLADHTKLEYVSFNANLLSAVDLTPLATCPAMRSVNFLNNGLTSLDLAPLENLTALRWLELEQNYLDGETCAQVCIFKANHPSCSVTSDCGCAQ